MSRTLIRAGKADGCVVGRPDEGLVKRAIQQGFTFIALSIDMTALAETSKRLLASAFSVAALQVPGQEK